MQQSQTILNYLNGNYLLTNSTDNQVITLEFDSQFYHSCFRFLHFQLFNHLNSSRPLLIMDLEYNFRHFYKNICQDKQFEEKDGILKYTNNIYVIKKISDLQNVLKWIEQDNVKSLEIIISGIELLEESILQVVLKIQQYPFRSQTTILIPKNFNHKDMKTILNISNCRLIIDQLIEIDQKLFSNGKEFKQFNILVTMVLKKINGHSFLKSYLIDGQELQKNKLKIHKIKKQQLKAEPDINKKIGASFNLQLSEEQKLQKQEVDDQINPYKNIINQENTPLIYQNEGDERRIILDDEQDDFEEVEEYEG